METLIKKYKDREWVYDQYWNKKLSIHKIAKLCSVASNTIRQRMVKFNIPRRSLRECALGKLNHFHGKHHTEEVKKMNSINHTGKKHNQWKGGRKINSEGYVLVWISSNSPYFPMREHQNYIREHRYMMAKYLGRLLKDDEIVHHINLDKADNRIENLQLMSPHEHNILHNKKGGDCPPCQ